MSLRDLDGFAYTAGPGLAGALLTGAMMMRSLAWSVERPALGVHHLEGHLLAPMLESDPPPYPFVCLLVSGGHTQLVRVDGLGQYRLLGESVDDAAGEAFDKTAKMLGIPYPGGKALAEMALEGDPSAIALPRPMLDRPGLDFSFSGLKTAAITRYRAELQRIEGERPGRKFMVNLAASFEAAVDDELVTKSRRALEQEGLERLVVSGGVSANHQLRQAVTDLCGQRGGQAYFPRLEFCTDNGAMIALAGALRLARGQQESLAVSVRPRWPLVELPQH
jgi:N6-L-threonylcarbamoyladenine synthase